MTRQVLTVMLALGLVGCADESDTDTGEIGLSFVEGKGRVAGQFTNELGTVEFRSQVGDGVGAFDVEVELRGMVVTVTNAPDLGVMEIDAYAAIDGGDTQILDGDRALLNALASSLDLGPEMSVQLDALRSAAAILGEFPNAMPLPYQVVGDNEKSANYCSKLNTYVSNKHDGWGETYGADNTTIDYGYVSTHGSCRAGDADAGNGQTTWWLVSGAWNCLVTEPNHSTTIEQAYGDCLGRCGGGCTTTNKFTQDCFEHDGCNRFGHSWAASAPGGHCADEFTGAIWDAANATSCF